jgi:hypothetical protein
MPLIEGDLFKSLLPLIVTPLKASNVSFILLTVQLYSNAAAEMLRGLTLKVVDHASSSRINVYSYLEASGFTTLSNY